MIKFQIYIRKGDGGPLLPFVWPDFRKKFKELHRNGEVLDFGDYLDRLKRVLAKPSPMKREVEKYVPAGIGVREKYMDILDKVGEMPEDETSRKVLFKMIGFEYEKYRKRALGKLNSFDRFFRKLSPIERWFEIGSVDR